MTTDEHRKPMLTFNKITIQALALLTLVSACLCGSPQNAWAGPQQGQACSSGAVAPIVNSSVSDGNNLVCVSGTWQYPVYTVQSDSGAVGASCSGYPTGALHYSTTSSNIEFCNGSNWNFLAAGSNSCGSPSGLSFTNLTSQPLSTVVTSNSATITFSGCGSSPLPVYVSGGGSPQISVNGGAWGTAGAISTTQTLRVRMTTSSSANTTVTASIMVGSTSTNWTTTTIGGGLKIFLTANTYIGNLGGLTGADAICQAEAGALGYAGLYKAILSDSTTSASSRLTLTYPIIRASNGVTVSASNLWGGFLNNVISTAGGWAGVWSGTRSDGVKVGSGYNCSDWTAGSGGAVGSAGAWTATTYEWIQEYSYGSNLTLNCGPQGWPSMGVPFYCIQQ